MMKSWYFELIRRNRLLAYSGLVCFIICIGLVILSFFDGRQLFGVNIWNKPIKFYLSIAVLFWTTGWLMNDISNRKAVRLISIGTVICLAGELVIINSQAFQGKASHFNVSTPTDGILFGIMGILIFVNSLFYVYLLILFARQKGLAKGYKIGVILGLIIFLIGGYEGYIMGARLSHTVGADDGQEGIFFLSWAKAYGDLRIFHFFALHGLQVLSLAGWYIFRHNPKGIWAFGLFYIILSSGTLWYALQGKSFLGFL